MYVDKSQSVKHLFKFSMSLSPVLLGQDRKILSSIMVTDWQRLVIAEFPKHIIEVIFGDSLQ